MRTLRSPLRFLLVAAALGLAPPLAAQEAAPPAGTATVAGRVVDATTGEGIPQASVKLPGLNRLVLTNDEGYFLLDNVPVGEHQWEIRRIGYTGWDQSTEVRDGDRFTVRIAPRPQVLEGITVTVNQFEVNRRRVSSMRVDAVDHEDILRSGLINPVELIASRANVAVTRCPPTVGITHCVWVRGELITPTVWIDEQPARAGLEELQTYSAPELYTVESYGGGRIVRVYTRSYVEWMAETGRRPAALTLFGAGGGSVRPGGAFAPAQNQPRGGRN